MINQRILDICLKTLNLDFDIQKEALKYFTPDYSDVIETRNTEEKG